MLNIDQLKLLNVGDWIWVIIKKGNSNYEPYAGYYMVTFQHESDEYFSCATMACIGTTRLRWEEYGKTWVAYRNKEEVTYPRSRIRNEALSEALKAISGLAESAHTQRLIAEGIPDGFEAAAYWANAEKRYWDAYAMISDLMTTQNVRLD